MRFSWDNKTGGGTGIGETGESEDWTYKKVSLGRLGIQPTSLHYIRRCNLQVASCMKYEIFNFERVPLHLPSNIRNGYRPHEK